MSRSSKSDQQLPQEWFVPSGPEIEVVEPTKVLVWGAAQSLVAPLAGPTKIGSSRRPACLPPTSMPTAVVTTNAVAVVYPRKIDKNTDLVELGFQISVLQSQRDVLQSVHGALSNELDKLYRKDW